MNFKKIILYFFILIAPSMSFAFGDKVEGYFVGNGKFLTPSGDLPYKVSRFFNKKEVFTKYLFSPNSEPVDVKSIWKYPAPKDKRFFEFKFTSAQWGKGSGTGVCYSENICLDTSTTPHGIPEFPTLERYIETAIISKDRQSFTIYGKGLDKNGDVLYVIEENYQKCSYGIYDNFLN